MKIKAKNEKIFGSKLIVPFDGLITIGLDGIVEVSENCGKQLIEGTNDWREIKENDLNKDQQDPDKKAKNAEIIKGIKDMGIDELVSLAKEAGYENKEWEKFVEKSNQKSFSSYMIKKFLESQK